MRQATPTLALSADAHGGERAAVDRCTMAATPYAEPCGRIGGKTEEAGCA